MVASIRRRTRDRLPPRRGTALGKLPDSFHIGVASIATPSAAKGRVEKTLRPFDQRASNEIFSSLTHVET